MYRKTLLLFFLLFSHLLVAQSSLLNVTKYTVDDGLSHNHIGWAFQDSKGIMWIGAANGLNKFDGTDFKLVKKMDLFETRYKQVIEDADGDLWIPGKESNSKGVYFFNIYSQKLKSFEEKFGPDISFKEEVIKAYVLLKDGSFVFGTKTGRLIFYDPILKKETEEIKIDCIPFYMYASKSNNGFWIYSKLGKRGEEQRFKEPKVQFIDQNKNLVFKNSSVNYIFQGVGISNDNHFLFSNNEALYEINQKGDVKKIKYSTISKGEIKRIKYDDSVLAYDPERNQFWLINNGEIHTFSKNKKEYQLRSFKYKSLGVTRIHSTFINEQFLWACTIDGLFKINLNPSPFQQLGYKDPTAFSQKGFSTFRGICSDNEGAVYFCTDKVLKLSDTISLFAKEKRKAILFDGASNLWLSKSKYIVRYNLDTGQSKSYRNKTKNNYSVWSFYLDKNNRLWIGGMGDLKYLDQDTEEIQRFEQYNDFENFTKKSLETYFFFKDQQQKVWLATSGGIFQLDINKGIIGAYSSNFDGAFYLPAADFKHIHQDKEGVFWLASKDGLVRWDKEKRENRLFNKKDGFANENIYAIYEDDYGFLWMSSDNGIIQFEKSTYKIRTFYPADGITHHEFNRISHHQAKDGTIYFGGLNGVTYFHPRDFYHSFRVQPDIDLLLTDCQLFSKKNNRNEKRLHAFKKEGKIVLNPGDNALQFQFSLLDYENPNAIQYAYAIDQVGNDESSNWIMTNDNKININFLPYGSHELIIKGRVSNGQFSKQVLNIPIEVLKPFYLHTWFFTLLGALLFFAFYFYQKRRTLLLKKRQIQLEETIAIRTRTIALQKEEMLELDKIKSKFLANISHELRTPLTLIMNSLSDENAVKVAKEFDKPELKHFYQKDIQIIQRNADRLHRLIEQLLDLSKLESGNLKLEASKEDFLNYLEELVDSFEPLARQKNVELEFDASIDQLDLYFDREKMNKVFYNLLSNAIKFTPEKGSVLVDLEVKNQKVFINVTDTGIGIPEKDLPFIFNRFYQVKRKDEYAFEGTGLGLAMVKEFLLLHQGTVDVESEIRQGTSFRLSLPVGSQHLKEEEIVIPNQVVPASRHLKLEKEEILKDPAQIILKKEAVENPILLIIEDNEDLLYHQQRLFRQDYDLLIARNGIQGIELAIEHIPDIILCDVMMPGKNGYDVCRELKTLELTDHIPIVLLTAKAAHEEKLEGLELGADSYLTKPYDQKELSLHLKNKLELIYNIQKKYKLVDKKQQSRRSEFSSTQSPFVLKVIDLIDTNIVNSNFGVEELAQEMSLSRSQLFRKLKALTGETPAIFIRKYRLDKARTLLENFEGNTAEIAYKVGFSSPNYFYKCFKKEYGLTPTELIN